MEEGLSRLEPVDRKSQLKVGCGEELTIGADTSTSAGASSVSHPGNTESKCLHSRVHVISVQWAALPHLPHIDGK